MRSVRPVPAVTPSVVCLPVCLFPCTEIECVLVCDGVCSVCAGVHSSEAVSEQSTTHRQTVRCALPIQLSVFGVGGCICRWIGCTASSAASEKEEIIAPPNRTQSAMQINRLFILFLSALFVPLSVVVGGYCNRHHNTDSYTRVFVFSCVFLHYYLRPSDDSDSGRCPSQHQPPSPAQPQAQRSGKDQT